MSDRLDPAAFDQRATAAVRQRLAMRSGTDLDRLVINPGWTLRGLLSHLVGGNIRFGQALRGEPADWPSRDAEPVTSVLAEFDRTADEFARVLVQEPDLSRSVVTAEGTPPAWFLVSVHATDMLIHSWDIAVATGDDRALEPDLCRAGLATMAQYPDSFWGSGRYFAQRIPTDSEDPQTRLLTLSGRDPDTA